MARLVQCGFEENSKTVGVEMDTVQIPAAWSLDTATVRTGTYSAKCAPAAAAPFLLWKASSANISNIGYVRCYVRFTTFPASTQVILGFDNLAGAFQGGVAVTSAGKLRVENSSLTQIGSDTAALSLNVWYRVECKIDATNATGTLSARYVACTGVADPGTGETTIATGNNNVQGSWAQIAVGMSQSANSGVCYFDDVACNDSTGGSQNSYPGAGGIIHLHPNAQGDSNGFGTQVGGTAGAANNYTRVNEIPPDDVTSYNASNTLNQEDLFKCGASAIGSFYVVNVVAVGSRHTNITAADATTAIKLEIEKAPAGTKGQSAAFSPNSTTWGSNGAAGALTAASAYRYVTYTDPDGAAWTQATLDTLQVGYKLTAANVRTIAVSNVWISVDFTPANGAATYTASAAAAGTTASAVAATKTAAAAAAATLKREPARTLTAAAGATATVRRAHTRTFTASVSTVAALTRAAAKTLIATSACAASVIRTLARAIPVSVAAGAALQRAISIARAATAAATATKTDSLGRSYTASAAAGATVTSTRIAGQPEGGGLNWITRQHPRPLLFRDRPIGIANATGTMRETQSRSSQPAGTPGPATGDIAESWFYDEAAELLQAGII